YRQQRRDACRWRRDASLDARIETPVANAQPLALRRHHRVLLLLPENAAAIPCAARCANRARDRGPLRLVHPLNPHKQDGVTDMAAPLPSGVSQDAMNSALERFRRIVGNEWVFADDKITPYEDPYTISNNETDHK